MRALRLALFFMVGIALGGAAVFAHAGNVLWAGRDAMIVRNSSGLPSSVSVASQFMTTADGVGGVNSTAVRGLNVGGSTVPVTLTQPISKSAVAVAGRVAAKLLGPVVLAQLAYDAYLVWNEAEQRWDVPPPDHEYVTGSWIENGYPQTVVGSPHAACSASRERTIAGGFLLASEPEFIPVYQTDTRWRCTRDPSGSLWAYADLVTPCAEGSEWVAGECVSVVGGPATDSQIEQAISQGLSQNPGAAPGIVDHGIEVGFIPDRGSVTASGPASVPGSSSTSSTSGPSGQTSTTTNTTHNLTYNNNTVTITNVTTTTIVHPDATETTTVQTDTPGGDGAEPEEPPQALCDEFPNASACQELGDPEDQELDEQDVSLDFAPENFGMTGSCPADKPFTHAGFSFALSWQPVCTFAEGIAPMVIATALLSAGLFVFAAARGIK